MKRMRGTHGEDPRCAQGRSLAQLFVERCAEGRDQVAMRKKVHGVWRPYTWREVEHRVRGLARGMGALGLEPGGTVAAIGENVVELYWIEYAALCHGARVVCMYPDISAVELAFLIEHSGASLLMAEDQEQVDKALEVRDRLLNVARIAYIDDRGLWDYEEPWLMSLEDMLQQGAALDKADPSIFDTLVSGVGQDDVAALCYTSGTTGDPKGVMLSHRYLLDNAYRLLAAFGLRRGAEYLSYISPAWAAEQITGLALGLLAPLTVSFSEKPETVTKDLRELGPEFLLFTPRQWEMMASEVQSNILDAQPWRQRVYDWAVKRGHARDDGGNGLLAQLADMIMLAAIRDNLGLKNTVAALSGGSGMSAEVFRLFRAYGVPLSNLYGSTELGLIAAHWAGRRDPDTMGELLPADPTIGPPLEIALSDDGELLVLQADNFKGYWRDNDATTKMRSNGALRSGDAVRLRDDGQLVFLDRVKDLRMLAGGERYPPQFIENHLRASPFIKDAIILGDERRPFVTALINIDAEIAGRFAERRGLAFGTFAELSQLQEIRSEIATEISRVNALLDAPARVKRFAALPKELDPDEAELTRSRKLRREQIEESYRDIVKALYDGSDLCQALIRIRYRDGQTRELSAKVFITDAREPA